MKPSCIVETELPGKKIDQDTLRIIAHRYYWASGFVAGKRVLEVGCGPGLGLGLFGRSAQFVVGGDITEESLLITQEHCGSKIELVRMDAHYLPFRDHCFDVVVCVAAIIYLNLSFFLAESHRVLRAGGILLLNTPNRDQPGFQASRLSRRYYSIPELQVLFQEHCFDPEFYGAFPVKLGLSKVCSSLRVVGRRTLKTLGLYEVIKQVAGFDPLPITLKAELGEEEMRFIEDIPLVSLSPDSPDLLHRIVYVRARPRQKQKRN